MEGARCPGCPPGSQLLARADQQSLEEIRSSNPKCVRAAWGPGSVDICLQVPTGPREQTGGVCTAVGPCEVQLQVQTFLEP